MTTSEELTAMEKAALFLMRKEEPMELRKGTIILEGDIKAKITSWSSDRIEIYYGAGFKHRSILSIACMNFRYARKKAQDAAPQ